MKPLTPTGSRIGPAPTGSPFYVLRGASFVWNHKVLWKYAAAPIAISVLILGASYILLYNLFFDWVGGAVPEQWYWQVLYYFLVVIVSLILIVVFFFLFTRIASALSAPFNELIAQKTEELTRGAYEDSPFSFIQLLKDSGRSIGHAFRILGVYIFLQILLLPLWLIPGIGAPLFSVASMLLSAYMLSYEYLGYPLDRRRYSFKEKRRFLKDRLRPNLGFGLGCLALASIPLVNILLIPAAVAGGTLLYLDLNPTDTRDPG